MKKYKSPDGAYLRIGDDGRTYQIAWYFPDIQETGACLGDLCDYPAPTTDEEKREVWEMVTASKAVEPFSSGRKQHYGFEFETEHAAKKALAAANAALNLGPEMPDWAVKAAAAGWTPPKGWKP